MANIKNWKEVSGGRMSKRGNGATKKKGFILWNLKGIPQLLAFLSLHVHSLDRDRDAEMKSLAVDV